MTCCNGPLFELSLTKYLIVLYTKYTHFSQNCPVSLEVKDRIPSRLLRKTVGLFLEIKSALLYQLYAVMTGHNI